MSLWFADHELVYISGEYTYFLRWTRWIRPQQLVGLTPKCGGPHNPRGSRERMIPRIGLTIHEHKCAPTEWTLTEMDWLLCISFYMWDEFKRICLNVCFMLFKAKETASIWNRRSHLHLRKRVGHKELAERTTIVRIQYASGPRFNNNPTWERMRQQANLRKTEYSVNDMKWLL